MDSYTPRLKKTIHKNEEREWIAEMWETFLKYISNYRYDCNEIFYQDEIRVFKIISTSKEWLTSITEDISVEFKKLSESEDISIFCDLRSGESGLLPE